MESVPCNPYDSYKEDSFYPKPRFFICYTLFTAGRGYHHASALLPTGRRIGAHPPAACILCRSAAHHHRLYDFGYPDEKSVYSPISYLALIVQSYFCNIHPYGSPLYNLYFLYYHKKYERGDPMVKHLSHIAHIISSFYHTLLELHAIPDFCLSRKKNKKTGKVYLYKQESTSKGRKQTQIKAASVVLRTPETEGTSERAPIAI